MEKEKTKKVSLITIILLTIAVATIVVSAGFLISSGYFRSNNNDEEVNIPTTTNKTYNLSDYIELYNDVDFEREDIHVQRINFKNIPSDLVQEFIENQEYKFQLLKEAALQHCPKNDYYCFDSFSDDAATVINADIKEGVLYIKEKFICNNWDNDIVNCIYLAIDLNNNEILNNYSIYALNNLDLYGPATKVYEYIENYIKSDKYVLSYTANDKKVTMKEYTNERTANIDKIVNYYFQNPVEKDSIYLKDGKFYIDINLYTDGFAICNWYLSKGKLTKEQDNMNNQFSYELQTLKST